MPISDTLRWREQSVVFLLEFDLHPPIAGIMLCEMAATITAERDRVKAKWLPRTQKIELTISFNDGDDSPTAALTEKLMVGEIIDRIVASYGATSDKIMEEDDARAENHP